MLSDNQRFPGVDPSSPNFLVGLLFSGSFAFFILRVFSVTNTSYLSTTHLWDRSRSESGSGNEIEIMEVEAVVEVGAEAEVVVEVETKSK